MDYSQNDIHRLNAKYGYGWINTTQVKEDKSYALYPTGDCSIQSGRKYIALSKPPTEAEKKKYNII
jgi:hypothetical protein